LTESNTLAYCFKVSVATIDIERPKIDGLSFVMCLLLAQLKIGFFSFFAVAVYSTNEANKAGLKQSIFLDVYGCNPKKLYNPGHSSHYDDG
jgi:hypothetical protein